jgi:hypothetical protein
MINDFFGTHNVMPRQEFVAMALRSLQGKLRMETREAKKDD